MSRGGPARRVSVLARRGGAVLLVCLRDPVTGAIRHYLPGGKVEPGETLQEAAVRELREETGWTGRLEEQPCLVSRYVAEWAGEARQCETHYLRAVTLERAASLQHAEPPYHLGAEWVDEARATELLAHHPQLCADLKQLI